MPAREILRRRLERANQTTAVGVALALLVLGMYGYVKQRYLLLAFLAAVACLVARSRYLRAAPCPSCGRPLGDVAIKVGNDSDRSAVCRHCGSGFG